MREGWEYKKIGDIATVVSGSTPQTSVEEFWGKDITGLLLQS